MRALALSLLILIPLCAAFDLSPANPVPGDKIHITGMASPDERVSFRSMLSMELPVAGGQYQYETRVQIPRKPNRFTVSASDVRDLNAGVRLGIWLTKRFEARGGTASISRAGMPEGSYDLKIFGEALPGVAKVHVDVVAETTVEADHAGRYSMTIDTSGIPSGAYTIEGAGDTRTIRLGGSSRIADPGEGAKMGEAESANSEARQKTAEMPRSAEITPEVVMWYAGLSGLECRTESQYAEAERLLKKRLSGGYWLVIAKGEPLTETAGYCDQKYCLVRGVDACRECRDKDLILRGIQPLIKPNGDEKEASALHNVSKDTPSGAPREKKGFVSEIVGLIERIPEALGIYPGG